MLLATGQRIQLIDQSKNIAEHIAENSLFARLSLDVCKNFRSVEQLKLCNELRDPQWQKRMDKEFLDTLIESRISVGPVEADPRIPRSSIHRTPQNRIRIFLYRLGLLKELGDQDYESLAFSSTSSMENIQLRWPIFQTGSLFLTNVSSMGKERWTNMIFEVVAQLTLIRINNDHKGVKNSVWCAISFNEDTVLIDTWFVL